MFFKDALNILSGLIYAARDLNEGIETGTKAPDRPVPDSELLAAPGRTYFVIVSIFIGVYLTTNIDKGRNWARIIIIVGSILGLLGLLISVLLPSSFVIEQNFRNPMQGALFVTQLIISPLILYFLCKKSSADWFMSP